jgi:hypothetical protein
VCSPHAACNDCNIHLQLSWTSWPRLIGAHWWQVGIRHWSVCNR